MPSNEPTLNVSPSPPVEIGQLVRFEVVLPQRTPPRFVLQYRFNFGDGSRTEWTPERQATHTYSSAGNGSYPVHVEIASTSGDRVSRTKEINENIDVIPASNPIPSATVSPSITASPTPITPSPTPVTPSPTPVTPTPTSSSTPVATASPTAIPSVTPTASSSSPFLPSKMLWLYSALALVVVAVGYLVYATSKPPPVIAPLPTFCPHCDWGEPQTPPENLAINYELRFNSQVSDGQDGLETDGGNLIRKKTEQ